MRIFLEKNKGVYKRCPNCNQPIEKNLGCKAMTCRSCRTQFCWDCLMIGQNIHSHRCSPSDNQATGSTTGENDPSNAICDFCHGVQPSEIAPMLCEHRACEKCYAQMLRDGRNNQNESICTICNDGNNEDALLGEATGVTRVQTRAPQAACGLTSTSNFFCQPPEFSYDGEEGISGPETVNTLVLFARSRAWSGSWRLHH